jgi:ribonuclease T2
MRRGDVVVLSISAVLSVIVVAAVSFSLLVLDRTPSSAALESEDNRSGSNSSWFVVTWGPSLCEVDPKNLGCAGGNVGRMGRTMVLHGLWPQPSANQYCGVPDDVAERARNIHSGDVPPLTLSQEVRDDLQSRLSDAAVMAPHEWYAHGTCSGVDPDVYFGDAAALTDQARRVLDPVFATAEGGRLALNDIRATFEAEFGAGAGDRVRMTCRNVTGQGSVLYEVQMSLPAITELRAGGNPPSLGALLHAGPPMQAGCRHGYVP